MAQCAEPRLPENECEHWDLLAEEVHVHDD